MILLRLIILEEIVSLEGRRLMELLEQERVVQVVAGEQLHLLLFSFKM